MGRLDSVLTSARLNKVTEFDAEPMPNMEEVINRMSGHRFYSKMDLCKGYWQLGLRIQNGWNNRISYSCVYAQIRSGLGMHLVTYSNHDTVLFLLIVPIKGRFV